MRSNFQNNCKATRNFRLCIDDIFSVSRDSSSRSSLGRIKISKIRSRDFFRFVSVWEVSIFTEIVKFRILFSDLCKSNCIGPTEMLGNSAQGSSWIVHKWWKRTNSSVFVIFFLYRRVQIRIELFSISYLIGGLLTDTILYEGRSAFKNLNIIIKPSLSRRKLLFFNFFFFKLKSFSRRYFVENLFSYCRYENSDKYDIIERFFFFSPLIQQLNTIQMNITHRMSISIVTYLYVWVLTKL